MSKHKKKNKHHNLLQYWLDELIFFRHDFTIESTASAEECAAAIKSIKPSEERGFGRHPSIIRPTVKPVDHSNLTYTFKVNRQPHGIEGLSYISAGITGTIRTDDSVSFIEGVAKISGGLYWAYIVFFFVVPLILYLPNVLRYGFYSPIINLIELLALPCFAMYLWWRMYRDRNMLVNELTAAIDSAEKQKRSTHLQDSDAPTHADYTMQKDKRHNQSQVG